MKNTLSEIENKTPHKKDLIQSMQKTISDLTFSYVFFCELENEYRVSRQRNRDLEFNKFKDQESLTKAMEQIAELKKYL